MQEKRCTVVAKAHTDGKADHTHKKKDTDHEENTRDAQQRRNPRILRIFSSSRPIT